MKLHARPERGGQAYDFRCPGCNETHSFFVGVNGRPSWSFNGSMERPTVQPSLLITSGCRVDSHKPGDACWCTYNAEHPDKPAPFKCFRCHSYIKDGRIQFLADCSHPLKGQTVDLPEWPT